MIAWTYILSALSAFLNFFMKHPKGVIIGLLILVIIYLVECSPKPKPCEPCPEIDTASITTVDSFSYPVVVYKPKIYFRDTGSVQWLFHAVDTAAILKDYFTKNHYTDTIANDSNALIVIIDEIWMNKIMKRSKLISIYPKTIWKTKVVNITQPYTPRNKVFLGAGVGRSIDQFAITANVMLLTRREHAYQLSYDMLNNDIYFTMYWKLKFNRRGR